VPTSSVGIRGEFGVFSSLPSRGINVGASGDAPSVSIDSVHQNLLGFT
jgi:hypothetical protein